MPYYTPSENLPEGTGTQEIRDNSDRRKSWENRQRFFFAFDVLTRLPVAANGIVSTQPMLSPVSYFKKRVGGFIFQAVLRTKVANRRQLSFPWIR